MSRQAPPAAKRSTTGSVAPDLPSDVRVGEDQRSYAQESVGARVGPSARPPGQRRRPTVRQSWGVLAAGGRSLTGIYGPGEDLLSAGALQTTPDVSPSAAHHIWVPPRRPSKFFAGSRTAGAERVRNSIPNPHRQGTFMITPPSPRSCIQCLARPVPPPRLSSYEMQLVHFWHQALGCTFASAAFRALGEIAAVAAELDVPVDPTCEICQRAWATPTPASCWTWKRSSAIARPGRIGPRCARPSRPGTPRSKVIPNAWISSARAG